MAVTRGVGEGEVPGDDDSAKGDGEEEPVNGDFPEAIVVEKLPPGRPKPMDPFAGESQPFRSCLTPEELTLLQTHRLRFTEEFEGKGRKGRCEETWRGSVQEAAEEAGVQEEQGGRGLRSQMV